jgi:alpha-L-fucosidase
MLTDIISKNGNLLLNVGPGPDGEWDSLAYNRLETIGKWMKANGEAVYETEADPNLPRQGKWAFTKKGTSIYAIYQVAENEIVENSLSVNLPTGTQVKAVSVIGGPQKVKFTQTGGQVVLFTADKSIVKQTEALVFKLVTN